MNTDNPYVPSTAPKIFSLKSPRINKFGFRLAACVKLSNRASLYLTELLGGLYVEHNKTYIIIVMMATSILVPSWVPDGISLNIDCRKKRFKWYLGGGE